jgi:Tfp pilus assembly protein PilX
MRSNSEKGSAMVFALILVLVLSVMAVSMMFLARSETFSGLNYRQMTQARYGAEAGTHAAANFLTSAAYVPPTAPFAGYNVNVYPVTDAGGNPIYLSSLSTRPSNYPDAQMQSAFVAATHGSLQASSTQGIATTVNYTSSAQLLTMQQVTSFGAATPTIIQTWQITSHGDISGVSNAEVEVVTVLDRQVTPTFAYAAFGDGGNCGTLGFSGNGATNSYDSASLIPNGGTIDPATLGGATPFNQFGGNVGTNGNQDDRGANVNIYGSLSTPNAGFGVCSAGNVTALSGGSQNQVHGGLVQLPQAVNFPTPSIPPPGATNISNTQTLAPGNYGDISVAGQEVITLTPGTYNINSISLAGQAQLAVAPDPISHLYGQIIVNVTGNAQNTPINIVGNGISNPTYDPSILQFLYAGTGNVKIAGNGSSAAIIYAPNAAADFSGNASFFGSVIANTLSDVGNGEIHYDLHLKNKLFVVGNYTLNSFTWNKY